MSACLTCRHFNGSSITVYYPHAGVVYSCLILVTVIARIVVIIIVRHSFRFTVLIVSVRALHPRRPLIISCSLVFLAKWRVT